MKWICVLLLWITNIYCVPIQANTKSLFTLYTIQSNVEAFDEHQSYAKNSTFAIHYENIEAIHLYVNDQLHSYQIYDQGILFTLNQYDQGIHHVRIQGFQQGQSFERSWKIQLNQEENALLEGAFINQINVLETQLSIQEVEKLEIKVENTLYIADVEVKWMKEKLDMLIQDDNTYVFQGLMKEGCGTIQIKIIDLWGKEYMYETKTMVVDQQPPILKNAQIGGLDLFETGIGYIQQKDEFLFKVEDEFSKIKMVKVFLDKYEMIAQFKEDGFYHIDLCSLPQGKYQLEIKIEDVLGNKDHIQLAKTIIIDHHAPLIEVYRNHELLQQQLYLHQSEQLDIQIYDDHLDIEQVKGYFQQPLLFKWEQSDGGHRARYQIDVSQLEDGKYPFQIEAIDKAGNKKVQVYDIVIDTKAPCGYFIHPKAYYHQKSSLYFQFQDQNFNVKKTKIKLFYQDEEIPIDIKSIQNEKGYLYRFMIGTDHLKKEGVYRIQIQGEDKANNQSQWYEHSFTYDTQAPEIAKILWDDEDVTHRTQPYYGNQRVQMKVFFTEDLSLIDRNRMSVTFTSTKKKLAYGWDQNTMIVTIPLNCMSERIEIKAFDVAGNQLQYSLPFKFTIEKKRAKLIENEKNTYIRVNDHKAFCFKIIDDTYDRDRVQLSIIYDQKRLDPKQWKEKGFDVTINEEGVQVLLKKKNQNNHTYEFVIEGEDLCQNSYQKSFYYVDDVIEPKVKIKLLEPVIKGSKLIVKEKAKVLIKIEEEYLDLKHAKIIVKKDLKPQKISYEWEQFENHYQSMINLEAAGNYQIYVEANDFSGNINQQKRLSFTIDHSLPYLTLQQSQANVCNKQVITLNWDDQHTNACLSFYFQGIDADHQLLKGSGRWYRMKNLEEIQKLAFIDVIKWDHKQCIFTIKNDFKGYFYFYVEDEAKHRSEIIKSPLWIVETGEQVNKKIKIECDVLETKDGKIHGLDGYHKPITLHWKLSALFSGIKQIEIKGAIQKTYSYKDIKAKGIMKDGCCIQVELEEKLPFIHQDDQWITLVLYDNAGAKKEWCYQFAMDDQKPILLVSTSKTGIVNEDVLISVDVIEDHYQINDFICHLQRDGKVEKSNWIWNADQASLRLSKEGSYQLAVCLKDALNQTSGWISIPNIIIDKTKPKITMLNEMKPYMNQHQAFILCVEEQHFDEYLVDLDIKGDFEIGKWNHDHDKHYLTLKTKKDGAYAIKLHVKDLAFNVGINSYESHFIMDTTKPQLTFTNVKPYTSIKEPFQPEIIIHEDHLLEGKVVLSGKKVPAKTYVIDHRQKQLSLPYLYQDDLYQLHVEAIDHANNKMINDIVFTLNQQGSQFTLLNHLSKDKYLLQSQKLKLKINNIDPVDIVSFTINGRTYPYTYHNEVLETLEPLKEGVYTIQLATIDAAGNYSKMNPLQIVCDETKPTATILLNRKKPEAAYFEEVELSIQTQNDDEISAIYINGEPYVVHANNKKAALHFTASKSYQVEVYLKDAAGHMRICPLIQFEIINPYVLCLKVLGIILLLIMNMLGIKLIWKKLRN